MRFILYFFFLCITSDAWAQCEIFHKQQDLHDILALTLQTQARCPQNVREFRDVLAKAGVKTHPAMVANRGRYNFAQGSFSFFEVASGFSSILRKQVRPDDLYFGHFTTLHGSILQLDQQPTSGKLMIEAIAWDYKKKFYNFYELIGQGGSATWFYRGDSRDALFDNQNLHLSGDKPPVFGKRMRCSACHNSGGPIMKEIAFPHNDWWQKNRPLLFGSYQLSQPVQESVENVLEAASFAKAVKSGIHRLDHSPSWQKFRRSRSLPEQLRPLFCTVEINLLSDLYPSESMQSSLRVDAQFFVFPLLTGQKWITINRAAYHQVLTQRDVRFPESGTSDADHAWLAPVKGYSDLLAIRNLIQSQIVSQRFAAAVLSVDLKNPLFSKERCQLLRLVPLSPTSGWQQEFTKRLQQTKIASAQKLAQDLLDTKLSSADFAERSLTYYKALAVMPLGLTPFWFDRLNVLRKTVYQNEISQNPLGQILEPGFRVIFPWPTTR